MVEAILVHLFPLVARGRPQHVSASGLPESSGLVLGCLHAWDNQGNVVVGLTFDYSPISWWDMMADLDANRMNNRFLRTLFQAMVPRVFLSKTELKNKQTCSDQRHFPLLLLFYGSSHLEVIIKDGSFDMEWFLALLESNHFYSSYEVKLLNPQLDSLPFEVLTGGDATVLPGLGLKNCSWFSEYEPGVLFTFWFKIQADWCPCHFAHGPLDGSSSNVGAFGFRRFSDPVRMTPSVCPNFSFFFSERTCSRDDGVSLGIVSCHPTVLSATASGVHHSLKCELQQMPHFSFSSADLAVCVCKHTCLRTCNRLTIWNLHLRKHANKCMIVHSDSFLSWSENMVVCLLFLTDVYQ